MHLSLLIWADVRMKTARGWLFFDGSVPIKGDIKKLPKFDLASIDHCWEETL
jgi:hypothetical protein